MTLTFNIQEWQAWLPAQKDEQPDVSIIPPLLRRRLSPLARAAMSVVMPLANKHGAMPLVYASRHGDLHRTLGLLEDIANAEPLSPTAFSLSVHNATAGLFSIQQGLTKNVTALSAGSHDLIPALLESLGQCSSHEPKILCVFCDEPPPAIYTHQTHQPEHPFALALVISRGTDWQLEAIASDPAVETNELPQAMQLLSLLKNHVKHSLFLNNGTAWHLSRCAQ